MKQLYLTRKGVVWQSLALKYTQWATTNNWLTVSWTTTHLSLLIIRFTHQPYNRHRRARRYLVRTSNNAMLLYAYLHSEYYSLLHVSMSSKRGKIFHSKKKTYMGNMEEVSLFLAILFILFIHHQKNIYIVYIIFSFVFATFIMYLTLLSVLYIMFSEMKCAKYICISLFK